MCKLIKKHAVVCANTSGMFSVHKDYNLQCFKHGAQKCSNLFKLHVRDQLVCYAHELNISKHGIVLEKYFRYVRTFIVYQIFDSLCKKCFRRDIH